MTWTIKQTTEPAYQPITLEEARDHLRLVASGSPLSHPDDATVEAYIKAATGYAEDRTNKVFAQREFTLKRASFQRVMELPVFPVLSVDTISYVDGDGTTQAMDASNFQTVIDRTPAFIVLEDVPSVDDKTFNAVTITVTVGIESDNSPPDADKIPEQVKQAIKLMVGHFYENREAVNIGNITATVPFATDALLWPHRVIGI